MSYSEEIIKRFWDKVEKTGGCWLWHGYIHRGYGVFNARKGNVRAHRFSYELTYGEIPQDLIICHRCDNKACVNPSHLYAGTQLENMADRKRAGWRAAPPERNGRAKLSWSSVNEIRQKYATGNFTSKKLAVEYSVSSATINFIVNGRSWVA